MRRYVHQMESTAGWTFATKEEKSAKTHVLKGRCRAYAHCELDVVKLAVAFDLSEGAGTFALAEWNTK